MVANKNVNLEIYEGEIHALIGENGAGKSTLMKILFGMETPEGGHIFLNGEEVKIDSPKKAISLGIGMVHQHFMLVDSLTIAENIVLGSEPSKYGMLMDTKEMIRISKACADKIQRYLIRNIFLDRKRMDAKAKEWVKDFNVLCTSAEQNVNMLSGGNIQKVVAARELTENVGIVVAEQPTRGIDAGASELIRTKLVELRDRGVAVLLISADLNEILELSDSCIVMYNGKINAYFKDTTNLTEEELGYYMLGVKKQSEEEVRALL